ncbi:MAG: HD domain-containing protein [Planctomycetota bacterium]
MQRCPGQDTRYWKPEDVSEVECGGCGRMLEFFKTDGARRCPDCDARVVNPRVSMGCAQWCDHARECLGFDPASLQVSGEERQSIADRLTDAVREEFGDDRRRIEHAFRVLDHAEDILREEGGDPRVVIAAALLHDVGIPAAVEKHGSSDPAHQEAEGPPIARRILDRLDFDPGAVDHVCRIIASHHSGGDIDTAEFRVVWDADRLVNIAEGEIDLTGDRAERKLERIFKTEAGKNKARAMFLGDTAEG